MPDDAHTRDERPTSGSTTAYEEAVAVILPMGIALESLVDDLLAGLLVGDKVGQSIVSCDLLGYVPFETKRLAVEKLLIERAGLDASQGGPTAAVSEVLRFSDRLVRSAPSVGHKPGEEGRMIFVSYYSQGEQHHESVPWSEFESIRESGAQAKIHLRNLVTALGGTVTSA